MSIAIALAMAVAFSSYLNRPRRGQSGAKPPKPPNCAEKCGALRLAGAHLASRF